MTAVKKDKSYDRDRNYKEIFSEMEKERSQRIKRARGRGCLWILLSIVSNCADTSRFTEVPWNPKGKTDAPANRTAVTWLSEDSIDFKF